MSKSKKQITNEFHEALFSYAYTKASDSEKVVIAIMMGSGRIEELTEYLLNRSAK